MRNLEKFAPLRRSTVGFENMLDRLDTAARAVPPNGFPPFNIEKIGDDKYRITLAIAGFDRDELEVSVEPSLLTVSGTKMGGQEGEFLYQGITTREFERHFHLADHVEVASATVENGILNIELVREIPEAMRPKKIKIGYKSPNARPRVVSDKRAA